MAQQPLFVPRAKCQVPGMYLGNAYQVLIKCLSSASEELIGKGTVERRIPLKRDGDASAAKSALSGRHVACFIERRQLELLVQYEMGIYDRFGRRALVNFSACKTIICRFYPAGYVTTITCICSKNKMERR
jgi:hypothetical protein